MQLFAEGQASLGAPKIVVMEDRPPKRADPSQDSFTFIICRLQMQLFAEGQASFGAPKIVVMEETRNCPIVGKIMQEMDVVFVDRKSETSRLETKEAIEEHCRTPLDFTEVTAEFWTTTSDDNFCRVFTVTPFNK